MALYTWRAVTVVVWTLAAVMHLAACLPAAAQSTGGSELLARARALSAEKQFPAVVALLDPHFNRHPEDVEVSLLLAQHQYWTGDTSAAAKTYSQAILHNPNHADLRLSYAGFLVEIGISGEAKRVLQPLGRENGQAEAIRGRIAWWAGDLSAAARHYRNALRTSPGDAEAVAALAAMRDGARPWTRISGRGGTDNQPLNQNGTSIDAGFFATPLQTFRAELAHTRFVVEDSAQPVSLAGIGYRGFWPALRLETAATAGLVVRTDSISWTGNINLGFRLPHGLKAGFQLKRYAYLYTLASISESVTPIAVEGKLSLDRSGWLGEAVLMQEIYEDDNRKNVAYLWLMAPLLRRDALTLQAGYGYGYQHTAEMRFIPVLTSPPTPQAPPEWEGRYVPYYTPNRYQSHSITAAFTLRPVEALTIRGGGSYGFAGSEEAPFVYLIGRVPRTGLYHQNIRPWNFRASVAAAITPLITLQAEGSHMVTTWYDASALDLSLYVRF